MKIFKDKKIQRSKFDQLYVSAFFYKISSSDTANINLIEETVDKNCFATTLNHNQSIGSMILKDKDVLYIYQSTNKNISLGYVRSNNILHIS